MRHLHVTGIPYAIRATPMDDCGMLDETAQEITVREGLPVEAETLVLAHELIHAFLLATGHRDEHDEVLVEAMARQWVAFMRDGRNAWFLERLTAGAL